MRVVVDANVIVSAFLSKAGNANRIIKWWEDGKFTLLSTPAIIDEIGRVLHYPKLAKLHGLSHDEIDTFITLFAQATETVTTTETLAISSDEPDNRYIECAIAGNARYLVTGDKKHLLPIGNYRGVQIVAPATFVARFQLSP